MGDCAPRPRALSLHGHRSPWPVRPRRARDGVEDRGVPLELINELQLEPACRQLVERLQEVRAVNLVAAGTLVLDVRARVQQVVNDEGALEAMTIELDDLADPHLQSADWFVEHLPVAAILIRKTDRGGKRVGLRCSV